MNYIINELSKMYQTKEEYIEECKRCFLKQRQDIQEQIQNADIEDLEYELKVSNFSIFEDFRKAIKYEIMLRNNFEIKI